jgi:maleylacetate reductase
MVRLNTLVPGGLATCPGKMPPLGVRPPTELFKGTISSLSVADFVFEQLPVRVVFGTGTFDLLGDEVERLELTRTLVIAAPSAKKWTERAHEQFGGQIAGAISATHQHVPADDVRDAVRAAGEARADGLIAIGGGSTIGLAKAAALEVDVPIAAVPTTYAGSEMTSIFGITSEGRKRTGRDRRVLPQTVIYDPLLTVSMPVDVTASTGMNALAHDVEAMYADRVAPLVTLVAEDSITRLARGLPASVKDPGDLEARGAALYGAFLAGIVLGSAGMAIHHRIGHVLGGSFGLPHGPVNAALLPHVVAFNRAAAPEAIGRVARALAVPDAARGLYDLAVSLGAPTSLEQIGMRREDLARAARAAGESPGWNPRPVGEPDVLAILEAAYEGRPPAANEGEGT